MLASGCASISSFWYCGAAEADEAMIAAYREADKVNLPQFKQKIAEIEYSDEDIKKFREIAARAGLGEMGGRQQGQVEFQGLLDAMLKELATAKHAPTR